MVSWKDKVKLRPEISKSNWSYFQVLFEKHHENVNFEMHFLNFILKVYRLNVPVPWSEFRTIE